MTIVCKMAQCPYYDNRGYCAKPTVVGIDQMGRCTMLWRKGQPRLLSMPFTEYQKDSIIIEDAETAVSDVIKEESEGDAESRSKDSINEAAASQNGNS